MNGYDFPHDQNNSSVPLKKEFFLVNFFEKDTLKSPKVLHVHGNTNITATCY